MNADSRPSRLLLGLLAAASAYGLAVRWQCLTDIPRFNDSLYGLMAKNYLKYGYPDFGLAQIVTPGPPVPRNERIQYQTHPPLAPLLSSLSVAAFGPRAWAVRLPHFLCGVATAVVLAILAAKLFGRTAGLWCAAIGAVLPIGLRGATCDPIGPSLTLGVALMALCYWRYSQTGKPRHLAGLAAAGVLGLLSDWPVYIYAFALAGHALICRTRARKLAMAALPAAAVAFFALFVLYGRTVPPERSLFGTGFGEAAGGWLLSGDAAGRGLAYGVLEWVEDFVRKYIGQFTAAAALVIFWLVGHAGRLVRTRDNLPDHHLWLLWLYPLPYVAVFHSAVYSHLHNHIIFLPAVAVTLAVLADGLYGKREARRAGEGEAPREGEAPAEPRRAAGDGSAGASPSQGASPSRPAGARPWERICRAALAVAGCLFLMQWSYYVLSEEDPQGDLGRRRVAWGLDLARFTAPAEPSAFALEYAQQMRFVADRPVEDKVDSVAKLAALRARDSAEPPLLFVPLDYPFADPELGRELIRTAAAQAGDSTLRFRLDRTAGRPKDPVRHLDRTPLKGGLVLAQMDFLTFTAEGGRCVLYLGAQVAGLPKLPPGHSLDWHVRFLDEKGQCARETWVPMRASASYFLLAPEGSDMRQATVDLPSDGWTPGWPLTPGRVDLTPCFRTTDAASVGRFRRLARLALRFATFRRLGNPQPVIRVLAPREGFPGADR